MARRLVLLCAAGAVLTLPAAPAGAATCAGAETEVGGLAPADARDAILCLVNNERSARGLNTVERESRLELAAQLHTDDMVARDFFSHVNLLGLDPFDRMELAGYRFSSAGENIAAGQRTAREVMEGWMASEGHCRNILGDQYTQLGVGVSVLAATLSGGTGTWTQNFGRPLAQAKPANPSGVADRCPVSGLTAPAPDLAEDVPPVATPPAQTGEEVPASQTDFPAGTPARLTATLRRTARRLVIRGRLARPDGTRVRIVIRRGGDVVFRATTRLRGGRYGVRIKTPLDAGRLIVVVRAAGQRETRVSSGR